MKKFLRYFSLILIAVLAFVLAGCSKDDTKKTTASTQPSTGTSVVTTPTTNDGKVDYTVTIKAINGKPISGMIVSFLLNGSRVFYDVTDNTGTVTYRSEPTIYDVEVTPLDGYILETSRYKTDLEGTPIEIECDTEIIDELAPASHLYEVGDVMYDFTVTDADGNDFNLISLFEDEGYSAVVLNFWYTTCTYCVQEFPAMEEAYNSTYTSATGERQYKDDVKILAINPGTAGYGDTADDIVSFKEQYGLTFDMMLDYDADQTNQSMDPALTRMFNITGFPTTVVIDRYGLISYFYSGAEDDPEKWTSIFDEFISPDYFPQYTGSSDEGFVMVEPIYKWPEAGVLEAVGNGTNYDGTKFNATYRPETNEDDAKWSWPFLVSEDGDSIVPSNSGYHSSFAIMYMDVELKADEVFTFDYKASSEEYDKLYVIVDGVAVCTIQGNSKDWETSYSYVAQESRKHTIAFTYLKDATDHDRDDTVYLKNFRIENLEAIDTPTYVFREASYGEWSNVFYQWSKYIEPVLGSDGFYHVGSATGPLLLADFLSETHWSNDTLYTYVQNNDLTFDGVNYNELLETYASYTNNSTIGYTPVTVELAEALKVITKELGHQNAVANENQWLELCVYYDAYATNGVQMENPIIGIAPFTALEFDENNEASFTFDRVIVPRGFLIEITPEVSGAYMFTTTEAELPTNGWLFDENDEFISNANTGLREFAIRLQEEGYENNNFELYYYLEAGQTYYLRAAFYDIYEFSELNVKYEYIAESYDVLTLASDGAFTTSNDDMTGEIIAGGITPVLGEDGYYHAPTKSEDTFLYCDFKYLTPIFSYPLETVLEKGGFDFRLTEDNNTLVDKDGYAIDENGNYLLDPETNEPYKIPNCTEVVELYLEENLITDTTLETYGMVKVDENFANILQLLMDKYTFSGVEHSWTKLCYYYLHLGA